MKSLFQMTSALHSKLFFWNCSEKLFCYEGGCSAVQYFFLQNFRICTKNKFKVISILMTYLSKGIKSIVVLYGLVMNIVYTIKSRAIDQSPIQF